MKERDHIILPSGRRFYANCGIIGIDAEGEVSSGYDDGGLDRYCDETTEWDLLPWPAADRLALADLMIERWTKYRKMAQEALK